MEKTIASAKNRTTTVQPAARRYTELPHISNGGTKEDEFWEQEGLIMKPDIAYFGYANSVTTATTKGLDEEMLFEEPY
jgi:hypothetical protein